MIISESPNNISEIKYNGGPLFYFNKMSFLICVSVARVCFNDNLEVSTVDLVKPKSVIV